MCESQAGNTTHKATTNALQQVVTCTESNRTQTPSPEQVKASKLYILFIIITEVSWIFMSLSLDQYTEFKPAIRHILAVHWIDIVIPEQKCPVGASVPRDIRALPILDPRTVVTSDSSYISQRYKCLLGKLLTDKLVCNWCAFLIKVALEGRRGSRICCCYVSSKFGLYDVPLVVNMLVLIMRSNTGGSTKYFDEVC